MGKILVATYRTARSPELVEGLGPDGTYAVTIDREPTLESHLRVAEKVMLKLGYRRRDYILTDGTAATDNRWRFTFVLPDDFIPPATR